VIKQPIERGKEVARRPDVRRRCRFQARGTQPRLDRSPSINFWRLGFSSLFLNKEQKIIRR
jgi:hypothetical protein